MQDSPFVIKNEGDNFVNLLLSVNTILARWFFAQIDVLFVEFYFEGLAGYKLVFLPYRSVHSFFVTEDLKLVGFVVRKLSQTAAHDVVSCRLRQLQKAFLAVLLLLQNQL